MRRIAVKWHVFNDEEMRRRLFFHIGNNKIKVPGG